MKTKPEPINPFDQILTVADQAARELDSEPVSEEWLRSVGFEKFGMSSLRIEAPSQLPEGVARFYLNCTKYMNILGPWELWNCFDDTAQPVGVCLPCVPKTRGDVIRLCSVLGIELKRVESRRPERGDLIHFATPNIMQPRSNDDGEKVCKYS